ncbi:MAG: QueT transporter family protein [Christensenellales bacterium]|jgi:uncharacterized membrane protein
MSRRATLRITQSAVIAALYAVLTILLQPISYGAVQFRVSELLTILPFFMAEAVPGLFVGCLISNILGFTGILDVVFGPLATLLAAYVTYRIRVKWLAPLPPVLFNAFIVGGIISLQSALPFWGTALSVGFGQLVVCYGGGLPLLLLIEKSGVLRKKRL